MLRQGMKAPRKGALVALRDRREEVIELLCDHSARDNLDVDAFEQRIDRAHRAGDIAELDALLADLSPATGEVPSTALAVPSRRMAVSARPDHPKSGYALAVLGGTERKGVWRVPRTLRVLTCMGGVDVETPLPGESEKEARKRRRREPRQRRRQRHLPA